MKDFLPSVKDWPTETLEAALAALAVSKHEQAPRAYAMVKAELKLRFGKFANKRPNGG